MSEPQSTAPASHHMLREIRQQASVAAALLSDTDAVDAVVREVRRLRPHGVIFAARGSSDNAALYGKYLTEAYLGLPAALAAPSIVTVYGRPLRVRGMLVVGLSQSGESPDIVEFIRASRRSGALTLAVTNAPGSGLARAAHLTLEMRAGAEHSVAATKTYLASLVLLAMVITQWSRDRTLRKGLDGIVHAVESSLATEPGAREEAERLRTVEGCLVTARGFNYATALESALKLKETCYVAAEALSAADLLHGPIAMVDRGFPVLLFAIRGKAAVSIRRAANRLLQQGADLVVIGNDEAVLKAARRVIPVRMSVPEAITPIPAVVPAQLFAYYLSVARGLNPDRPRGLQKVTRER